MSKNYFLNSNKDIVKMVKDNIAIGEKFEDSYIDADEMIEINKPLYLDYLEKILKKNSKYQWVIPNKSTNFKLRLETEDDYYLFTTDYIGPSRHWMTKDISNIDEKYQKQFNLLSQSRILGGHIIWPAYNRLRTTNQARGGKAFFDRIDWTLAILKIYFEVINSKNRKSEFEVIFDQKYSTKVEGKIEDVFNSFENYHEVYNVIETFENFCNMHLLIDSFVDSNYEVNFFDDNHFNDFSKPIGEVYSNNCLVAIKERQKIIDEQ